MKYEVLTYTLCDGWVNCWTDSDAEGNATPSLFDSREAAQAEVDDYFASRRDAGMDCDDELMIVEVDQ